MYATHRQQQRLSSERNAKQLRHQRQLFSLPVTEQWQVGSILAQNVVYPAHLYNQI
jgi:hypothetical protein